MGGQTGLSDEDRAKITWEEVDCKQKLFDYAESNYDEECRRYAGECPYEIESLKPEFQYKQIYSWFMTKKTLPSTGRTVLEEFVEKNVSDPALARRMLQMRDVVRGDFKVLDFTVLENGAQLATFEHLESGRKYEVVFSIDNAEKFFKRGEVIFNGRIHPWGNRYYRFFGILTKRMSDEEMARRLGLVTPQLAMGWYEGEAVREAESIVMGPNCTLHAVMSKYPSQWVDGMCLVSGLSKRGRKKDKVDAVVAMLKSGYVEVLLKTGKLPGGSVEALRMLVENGYALKYGVLAKRFSTDIGLWWDDNPPSSEIGVLRLHGLVVVGRMPINGKLYRVAVVPVEARAPLRRFFSANG